MDTTLKRISEKINLDSKENEILLNPRWPQKDYQALYALAKKAQLEMNLSAHVWIATSGSTADSIAEIKLVAISKKALQNSAVAVNKHLQSDSKDVWAQVLPFFHVGGLGIEIRAALSGAKVVDALIEDTHVKSSRWDVKHFYKTLIEQNCTLSALVPTQIYDLVSLSLKAPPNLRAIVVGGGAFEPELYKKARMLGWPVLPSYGMTETSSQIATASLDSLENELFEFPDLNLLSHAQVQQNSEGFIKVNASSLFTCYAQNSAEGCKVWDPKKEGWFLTEDKGDIENNCLLIEGRHRDYIKIGGEGTNIARLRSILDACALTANPSWPTKVTILDMPSERLGKEIHLVSLLSQEDTRQLMNLYSEKVLPFEKVRQVHYIKNIPRSDLGKILWSELRKQIGR
ncbi:MAG: AMP-binding protein [Bdellovibrio sp.]